MKNILLSATILAASIFASCQKSDVQPIQAQSTISLVSGSRVFVQTKDTTFLMVFASGTDYQISRGQVVLQNISHTDAAVRLNGSEFVIQSGATIKRN